MQIRYFIHGYFRRISLNAANSWHGSPNSTHGVKLGFHMRPEVAENVTRFALRGGLSVIMVSVTQRNRRVAAVRISAQVYATLLFR